MVRKGTSLRPLFASACLGILIATSLSGCGGSDSDDETFESVEALKDAYVKAGGSCDSWSQDDQIETALESGSCDDDTRLSIYSTHLRALESVRITNSSVGDMIGYENLNDSLVGSNWVINSDENLAEVQVRLGGEIKTPPVQPDVAPETDAADGDQAELSLASSFAAAVGPHFPSLGSESVGGIYAGGVGVCSALVGEDMSLAKSVLTGFFVSGDLTDSETQEFISLSVKLLCPEHADLL